MNTTYRLGIDIGSTTVKIACLDDENQVVFSDYERHFANIRETLLDLIIKAKEAVGNVNIHGMITGSGGMSIARPLNIPFVQEVISAKNRCGDRARRRRCKNHLFFSGKY